jgi:hypothetical protein
VGAGAGLERVVEDLVAAVVADAGHGRVHLVAAGRADVHREAQDLGRLQPGVGHVVAVADPGHDLAPQALQGVGVAAPCAAVLDEGEQSARIWQGWNSLVRPLITGTRECAAKSSSLACS